MFSFFPSSSLRRPPKQLICFFPETCVGGDAAGDDDGFGVGVEFLSEGEFFEENVDSGLLEGGGKVSDETGWVF